MKVLFVSGELIGASLCLRLKKEGCDVKLYIKDRSRKDCLDGMVEKVSDWKKELKWVGKDGLIVFDDVGYGKVQDELRRRGYRVVGGSAGGDMLEKDREYAQRVFASCGMKIVDSFNFNTITDAIDFVEKNKGCWVVKQNAHLSPLNYVGRLDNGSDVIDVLNGYREAGKNNFPIHLQEKIAGIEIGVARYFNGKDWVGPVELNVEHKYLCNGDLGPLTGEMGTVMWYDNNEGRLFRETLDKVKDYLVDIDFRGDVDINCIVNEAGAYPIEATSRFGCPSTHLQENLHISRWTDFLSAVADEKDFELKHKKAIGVIVSVVTPPFPLKHIKKLFYSKGLRIIFSHDFSAEEMDAVHFEEVSKKSNEYYISGNNGFILYVSGIGKNIKDARKKAYAIINKIIVPKMFYRTDIGEALEKENFKKLKNWGWI